MSLSSFKKFSAFAFFVVLLSLFTTSCTETKHLYDADNSALFGKWWRLKYVKGVTIPTGAEVPTPYIEFNKSNIGGNFICNIIESSTYFAHEQGKMTITDVTMNPKQCANPDYNKFDQDYRQKLLQVTGWAIENNDLILYAGKEKLLAYYPESK